MNGTGMNRKISLALICLLSTFGQTHSGASQAQTLAQPIAVVNDDIITRYDLDNRVRLAISSSGLSNDPQTIAKTSKQVMQALVNETLQLQEAQRVGINIGPTDVDNAIANIAKRNGTDMKSFLATMQKAVVTPSTLRNQVKAQMSWGRLVGARLSSQVNVTDEEVERNVQRLRQNKGRTERLLAEIFLPADQNGSLATAEQTAGAIVQQLRAKSSFGAIAQQFSQSPTAANGGDLGWVIEGQLSQDIERELANVPRGAVTKPIRTPNGIYLYAVRGTRQIGVGKTVNFARVKQLFIRLPADLQSTEGQQGLSKAYGVSESVRGCPQFDNAMATLGDQGSQDMGEIDTARLPAELGKLVNQLPIGQPSPPVPAPNGAAIFIVCGRSQKTEESSIDPVAIRQQMQNERLSVLAQRYLRDLKRQAYIDMRI
jgi:peptidyl-prolyl cis-trans isomerase SurA